MTSTEILDHEHQQIIEEDRTRRVAAERRHAVPGCGYGCWDGWHEIALSEYGPLDAIAENAPAVIVYPHMIVFACECNTRRQAVPGSPPGDPLHRWAPI